jgi:hypothetical protein
MQFSLYFLLGFPKAAAVELHPATASGSLQYNHMQSCWPQWLLLQLPLLQLLLAL